MAPVVIVVNGGSSSGKTTTVRHVQGLLEEPWLAASIDGFVESLPPALQDSAAGFGVTRGWGGVPAAGGGLDGAGTGPRAGAAAVVAISGRTVQ